LLSRAFSRTEELEADGFAETLVRTAGGDPLAGESLLEKLARPTAAQGGGIAGDYFAAHPALMDRVINLRVRRAQGFAPAPT